MQFLTRMFFHFASQLSFFAQKSDDLSKQTVLFFLLDIFCAVENNCISLSV